MREKTFLILGVVFFLASGFVYTLERLNVYVYWLAQSLNGEFPVKPDMSEAFNNLFVPIFLALGIVFFVVYFVKRSNS
ncbi:hypothetical protein [Virgibacillus senegalensis]|uniref:hypothetical protein n=1 Tax=Virgibacillus senegalensis TaxID=1499679 RepID=UPI00069F73B4|nr:hypothetical protein [Virgibacillus senegalensis]